MYSVNPLSTLRERLAMTCRLLVEFEANLVAFLEGDVEVSGIEDLAEFLVDGPQDFVLIKPGADGLTDLGEEFVLLGAALGVVHDHVVFERQPNLQGQADQQAQVRGSEHVARGIREKDDTEIVLAGLQADSGEVADVLLLHDLAELL